MNSRRRGKIIHLEEVGVALASAQYHIHARTERGQDGAERDGNPKE
jgi:hypothetical protein